LVGLINGSFYAVLSMGLAIIFASQHHQFHPWLAVHAGAFVAWLGLTRLGPWLGHDDWAVNYWAHWCSAAGGRAFGMLIERVMLKRLYHLDHLYGCCSLRAGAGHRGHVSPSGRHSGESYDVPEAVRGDPLESSASVLPKYRIWVVAPRSSCVFSNWWVIERTRLRICARHRKPAAAAGLRVNVPL